MDLFLRLTVVKFSRRRLLFSPLLISVRFLFVVPPSIEHQPSTIYVIAGQTARFPCDYRGFPRPSVYWTVTLDTTAANVTERKKGVITEVVDGKLFIREMTVTPNGSLVVPQVLTSDSEMQYQCTAINRLGAAKSDVKLTVVRGRCTLAIS